MRYASENRRKIKRAIKKQIPSYHGDKQTWKGLRAYWLNAKRNSETIEVRKYAAYVFNLLQ